MEQKKILKAIVIFMTVIICIIGLAPLLMGFPLIMAFVWMGFSGVFLFMLHGVIYKKIKKKYEIMEEGWKGTAIINNIIEYPEFQQQYNTTDIFTSLSVTVNLEGKEPYLLDRKERINTALYKNVKVGATIPIRMDKKEGNEIIFMIDKIIAPTTT